MSHSLNTIVKALKSMLIVLVATAVLLIFFLFMFYQPRTNDAIRLNELLLNPAGVGWDDGFIELYNGGSTTVNVEGWSLVAKSGSRKIFGDIKPREYMVLYGELAATEGDIVLLNAKGEVVDSYEYSPPTLGVSVGRYPDGSKQWVSFNKPTPGEPNSYNPQLTTTTLPIVPAPQCMRDEFETETAGLRDIGYVGGVEKFCEDFKIQTMEVNPYMRQRITKITDPEIKAVIVKEVADRSIAGKREERTVNLVVSDKMLLKSIKGLIGDDLISMGLEGELIQMNGKFRAMLFDVIVNGTKTEQGNLRLQFKFYLERRGSDGGKSLRFNPDKVRTLLSESKNISLCEDTEYYLC